MNDVRQSGLKQMIGALVAALVSVAEPAIAESRYACSGLDGGSLPVVETESGVFLDLETDLLSDTRIPWPVIEDIARVAEAFDGRGSRLIVAPLPTKGLVYGEELGTEAETHGFDPALAEWLYGETLARLGAAGVTAIDALAALRDDTHGATLFATDPRLTNDGIRVLANATRAVLGGPKGANVFSAMATGRVVVPSIPHQQIQARCNVFLPLPESTAYDTISLTSVPVGDHVMLAGSGAMVGEGLVAEGLFEAALGADVSHVVAKGYPLDALAAVVGSADFQLNPPKAVVWVMPIATDLAAFGPRPLQEISGIVRQSCRAFAQGEVALRDGALLVDLAATVLTEDTGLMVKLAGGVVPRVDVEFTAADGATHTRTILRHGIAEGTSSFLMPFASVWADDVQSVRVTTPDGWKSAPDVAVCGV